MQRNALGPIATIIVVAIALAPFAAPRVTSALDGPIVRVAGADRYATAAALSRATFGSGVPVAYVVTGTNYPDALVAGPAAARAGGPVLLTNAGGVPAATAEELRRLNPRRIVIVGGTGVVSDSVHHSLDGFAWRAVTAPSSPTPSPVASPRPPAASPTPPSSAASPAPSSSARPSPAAPLPTTAPPLACPASLQGLVDAAPAGSTISVGACTFAETVTIRKALTLVGSGARIDGQGARRHGFVVGANDVVIDGFEVTNTVNPEQEGAVQVRDSSRFTLRNSRIHDTGGACISISGGAGHQVLDNELASCAQEGFHLTGLSDTIVARNQIHHNNPNHAYDMEWEAGGGKATRSSRLLFEANEVYANGGPGLWCDLDCRSVTYTNNRVHHNAWAGIMFEISDGAVIAGNRTWENGWGKTTWGWGAGILVASSRNVEVYGNVVAWNADGISVISQDRSSTYAYEAGSSTWNSVVNVYVHSNDIIVTPQASDGTDKHLLAWLQDWGGVMFDAGSNNRGAGNRYWHALAEPSTRFAWDGGESRLANFQATPGDPTGRYMTTAERDAVLAAAGVPAAPEGH